MVDTVTTKQADPHVKLPAAVVAASARATELAEKFKADNSGSNRNTMVMADINSANSSLPDIPKRDSTSSTPTAPSPAPTPTPTPTPASYTEQQFKSMQGRFEHEQQTNKDLTNRLTEMQRLVAFMQAPSTPPNSVGQGDTRFNNNNTKLVTEKERQEYGEELLDVVKRTAREVYDPIVSELRFENEQLKRSLGGIQNNAALDSRSRLYQELNKEIPDWEATNNDPAFAQWANQIDPLSGSQRMILIRNAYETGQASRVIAAFRSYKAEQAALSPAQDRGSQSGNGATRSGSDNASHSRSNAATTPAVDLASLAAPGRAGSGQVSTSPDKPIVLSSEIGKFYSDVTRGLYRGRDNDRLAVEKQIQEALNENRVRRDT